MRIVLGVVRSAKGVPGGMLEKPVEKVWVNAARGGAASGNESLPLAMKRAVEMGAIIFVFTGEEVEGSVVGTRSAWVEAVRDASSREEEGGAASGCCGGAEGLAEPGSGSVLLSAPQNNEDSKYTLMSGKKPAPLTPSFSNASAIYQPS